MNAIVFYDNGGRLEILEGECSYQYDSHNALNRVLVSHMVRSSDSYGHVKSLIPVHRIVRIEMNA